MRPGSEKGFRSPILLELPPNPHEQRAESHPSKIFCQEKAGFQTIGTNR
jgi:hypothetical protein